MEMVCTAFDGNRILARGAVIDVALAVRDAHHSGANGPLLVFEDASGKVMDLDLRGTDEDIISRIRNRSTENPQLQQDAARGRGRPKLGVVAREVTLLPRHWDWLSEQPGGASVALRKLIDEARKATPARDTTKTDHERAYRFMSAMAGDLPGFEEATRALFANDRTRMEQETANWPADVQSYTFSLAFPEKTGTETSG